jgi:hypothetical protein
VRTRNACKILPENRRTQSTHKAMCNRCVNNIKINFSLLKLEIHLNTMRKVRCYRTMQIPSLITELFRENAGVFNRKIIRKYTKRKDVKLFNTKTGGTNSSHFALNQSNARFPSFSSLPHDSIQPCSVASSFLGD